MTEHVKNDQSMSVTPPEEKPTGVWANLSSGTYVFLGLITFLILGVAVGGFLRFAEEVANLEPPSEIKPADGIVVLTGGYQRIDQAVALLQDGGGGRLLISGVNPTTTGTEIRKATSSSKAMFDCCVDIGHDAIDTIGNANETARWISEKGYKRVYLVTNNYHMPRSLLELRRVDTTTEFIPWPVVNTDLKAENWLFNRMVVRTLLSEYAKFSLAQIREAVGQVTESGLRTDAENAENVAAATN